MVKPIRNNLVLVFYPMHWGIFIIPGVNHNGNSADLPNALGREGDALGREGDALVRIELGQARLGGLNWGFEHGSGKLGREGDALGRIPRCIGLIRPNALGCIGSN